MQRIWRQQKGNSIKCNLPWSIAARLCLYVLYVHRKFLNPHFLYIDCTEGLTRLQYRMIGFLNRISGRHHHLLFWRAHTSVNLRTGKLCVERCTRNGPARGSFLRRSKVLRGHGPYWTYVSHGELGHLNGRTSFVDPTLVYETKRCIHSRLYYYDHIIIPR